MKKRVFSTLVIAAMLFSIGSVYAGPGKDKVWNLNKPVKEEKVVVESPVEEPLVEEVVVAEMPVEEPAVEEPAVQEPAVEEPAVAETPMEEPVAQEAAAEEPAVQEPAVEEAVVAATPVAEPTAATADLVNVLDFGAKGDGVSDDTAAIQNALKQNKSVYLPDGTYLIDVDRSLRPASGQTIMMSENAVLKAIPTSTERNAVILISGVDNVTVTGGKIIGERNNHSGSTGEWGMGIRITDGASNITVSDMAISDCWGDGVYIGSEVGAKLVDTVTIDNVVSDNNRRQGLSITYAQNVTVSGSVFKNTNGTAPQSGIDIEPNRTQFARDIRISNTQCYGNEGVGLVLYGKSGTIERIEVTDCTLNSNGNLGLALITASDLTFRNTTISDNWNGIEVRCDVSDALFQNATISENLSSGVKMAAKTQSVGIENIVFEDSLFVNNGQYAPGAGDGIEIRNADSTGYIKNIQFKHSQFIDNQASATQRSGIAITLSGSISGIVDDAYCLFSGNILGSKIYI